MEQLSVPRSQHVQDNWLPVRNEQIRYLDINTESTFVNEKMPFAHRLAFWNKFKDNLDLLTKDEL